MRRRITIWASIFNILSGCVRDWCVGLGVCWCVHFILFKFQRLKSDNNWQLIICIIVSVIQCLKIANESFILPYISGYWIVIFISNGRGKEGLRGWVFVIVIWNLPISSYPLGFAFIQKTKKNVEKYQWHAFQLGESH